MGCHSQVHGGTGDRWLENDCIEFYCCERGLFPEQVDRWRQTAQDAITTSLLNMAERLELEKLRAQVQKEIKRL